MGKNKGKEKEGKKADKKNKDKIVEDKTFGLKNKKNSKKVQNYIKNVENQVYNKSEKKQFQQKKEKKEKEKKQQEEMKLLGFLQKSMGKPKKEKEEEAKKLEEEKKKQEEEDSKTAKINIYVDPREPDPTRSPKVCDHFINAWEKNVYGWGWSCPNGGNKCQYTHALPEGYMLKSTMDALMKMQKEEDEDKAIEYEIEEERAKLDPEKWTPVNKETFEKWHKKRREKFLKERKEKDKQAQEQIRGKGNKSVFLSGRALMKYDANMFKNEDEEGDDDEEEEKHQKKKEDEDVHELRFGIDEEEEELNKEIEKARKMNINEELFNEDADDVNLDDLE